MQAPLCPRTYQGKISVSHALPLFLANKILLGLRPLMSMRYDWRPVRAIWLQNCLLNKHRWLQVGSVLYTYWLKMLSLCNIATHKQGPYMSC